MGLIQISDVLWVQELDLGIFEVRGSLVLGQERVVVWDSLSHPHDTLLASDWRSGPVCRLQPCGLGSRVGHRWSDTATSDHYQPRALCSSIQVRRSGYAGKKN